MLLFSYSERNFKGFVHRLEEAMDMCFSPLMTCLLLKLLFQYSFYVGMSNEWGKLTTVMAEKWDSRSHDSCPSPNIYRPTVIVIIPAIATIYSVYYIWSPTNEITSNAYGHSPVRQGKYCDKPLCGCCLV